MARRAAVTEYERDNFARVKTSHPTAMTFEEATPDRDHVEIYRNRDGSFSYYLTTVNFMLKFQAVYGVSRVSWIYPEDVPAGVEVYS